MIIAGSTGEDPHQFEEPLIHGQVPQWTPHPWNATELGVYRDRCDM
jgi:hypothetical protein